MEDFLLAACQIDCGGDSPPALYVEKVCDYIALCAQRGARLILFPELSLTGYTQDRDQMLRRALKLPCCETERMCRLAAKWRVAVAVGLFEVNEPYAWRRRVAMRGAPIHSSPATTSGPTFTRRHGRRLAHPTQ